MTVKMGKVDPVVRPDFTCEMEVKVKRGCRQVPVLTAFRLNSISPIIQKVKQDVA